MSSASSMEYEGRDLVRVRCFAVYIVVVFVLVLVLLWVLLLRLLLFLCSLLFLLL